MHSIVSQQAEYDSLVMQKCFHSLNVGKKKVKSGQLCMNTVTPQAHSAEPLSFISQGDQGNIKGPEAYRGGGGALNFHPGSGPEWVRCHYYTSRKQSQCSVK